MNRNPGPGAVCLAYLQHPFLELESGAASGVRQGRDATRVTVATAVEDDLGDPGGLGTLTQERTHFTGDGALVALRAADRHVQARGRDQGVTLGVVHDLGGDVAQRAGDDQAGTLRGSADVLANAEVPTRPAHRALGGDIATTVALDKRGGHFLPPLPPALPALRR